MAPADSQELIRILRDARASIATPEQWQPSGYAANAVGKFVPVGSPYAVRFSALGALIHSCRGSRELFRAVRLVTDSDTSRATLDSPLTHEESLELLDRALAALTGEPAAYVPKQSGFVPRMTTNGSDASAIDAATTEALDTQHRSGGR
jgi:hypothetical protein